MESQNLEFLYKQISELKIKNNKLERHVRQLASMVRICLDKLNVEQTDFIMDYEQSDLYWDYQAVQEEI